MTAPLGGLRHFSWIPTAHSAQLFHQPPRTFPRHGDPERLAYALGATLYMPATRPTIAIDQCSLARRGVVSSVVCLEDAIPDGALSAAEENLGTQLARLSEVYAENPVDVPLMFVRVREPAQIKRVVDRAGENAALISGFVLPKFEPACGHAYLDAVQQARTATGVGFLSMPVLESALVLHLETRLATLIDLRALLADYHDQVLAIRLGATDFLSVYGLRRSRDITVYDIPLLAHAVADIVNVLGRPDGHVVTGPVWEYFAASGRLLKPQLRQTPFEMRHASQLRRSLLTRDFDGLLREAVLDRANGLTGKTVIHPSHVLPVHALSVVPFEEYKDAIDIVDGLESGGVKASAFKNKMNEGKPHASWARRTLLRAEVFGVSAPDVTFIEFLQAGVDFLDR